MRLRARWTTGEEKEGYYLFAAAPPSPKWEEITQPAIVACWRDGYPRWIDETQEALSRAEHVPGTADWKATPAEMTKHLKLLRSEAWSPDRPRLFRRDLTPEER